MEYRRLKVGEGTVKLMEEWEEDECDKMERLLKDCELEMVCENPEMLRVG